ncbi:DNA integrity scanning diadenylate cyclase DisA [Pseudothermotoga thermarum]|uniref:DNA integrity scanning diadenylate cyclase DisA n=1 Tax=Pseudothermotoga thermarum TaxID=119394 RepID=UPI00031D0018|nr:DNA integrity scanning diadenylate cyclase DisA [Pseudothermotoga thermarum]
MEKIALLSPGTKLRKALEDIIAANLGALLFFVDDVNKYRNIMQGGFELNCSFTPERLYELAKMDGAIILSEDVTKIFSANVHLVPDPNIPTTETGIRHRTAERVAKQTGKMVVAISKRRNVISLYVGDYKYVLNDRRLLMTKSTQALNALEKYRTSFEKIFSTIENEELRGISIYDVARAIEKALIMLRIWEDIYPYIVELGEDGKLISLQMSELLEGLDDIVFLLVMDYSFDELKMEDAKRLISKMKEERDLSTLRIVKYLGWDVQSVAQAMELVYLPRGYRILKYFAKLPITVSAKVVERYKNLKALLTATIQELMSIEGVGEKRAHAILDVVEILKSKIKQL